MQRLISILFLMFFGFSGLSMDDNREPLKEELEENQKDPLEVDEAPPGAIKEEPSSTSLTPLTASSTNDNHSSNPSKKEPVPPAQDVTKNQPVIFTLCGLPDEMVGRIIQEFNLMQNPWLFVSHKYHNLSWQYCSTVVAQTPSQMRYMNDVLEKHKLRALIVNIAFWGFPEQKRPNQPYVYPCNANTFIWVESCINLKKMIIGKGPNTISCTKEDFQKLQHCPLLELVEIDHTTLPIEAFTKIIDGKNSPLLAVWKNLKSLRLRGINAENDEGSKEFFRLLGQNCKHVKRVGIWHGKGSIADSCIIDLQGMKDLAELILSPLTSTGDKGIKLIEFENMGHIGLFYSENNDADFTFQQVLKMPVSSFHCGGPKLGGCITWENFAKMTKLTQLSISRCLLNDCSLAWMALAPEVIELRISATSSLADGDLAKILNFIKLKQLSFDNLRSITSFGKFCDPNAPHPTLEELSLNAIPKITDDELQKLANLPKLKKLIIKNCQLITEDGVNRLKETLRLTGREIDVNFTPPPTTQLPAVEDMIGNNVVQVQQMAHLPQGGNPPMLVVVPMVLEGGQLVPQVQANNNGYLNQPLQMQQSQGNLLILMQIAQQFILPRQGQNISRDDLLSFIRQSFPQFTEEQFEGLLDVLRQLGIINIPPEHKHKRL